MATTLTPAVAVVARNSAPFQATLENGMHVVIVTDRLAPVVSTSLVYGVGSNDDTIPGMAHATEHMMFRGTTDISSDQFANIATRIGAEYNADTTNMTTHYYFTAPSSYLDVVLRLEADRMQHAAISQASWTNERGAIEQEVKAHLGNPLLPAMMKVNRLFYGDSPWGREAVGTIAGFEKMRAADITSFYHTWYHPNNATLVISGDVDAQSALRSVRRIFGPIPSQAVPAHPALTVNALTSTSVEQTVDFPLPVAIVMFRLPGFNDPDYAATEVLFTALNNAREKLTGLSLDGKALVALAFQGGYPSGGVGFLMSVLRPGTDAKVAQSELASIIGAYAKSGLSDDVIEASKARLLASRAYVAASIPGQAREWSAALAIEHKTPPQLYAQLDTVTPERVNAVFHRYIADAAKIDVVLDAKPGAPFASSGSIVPKEDVTVTADKSSSLPAWTKAYFSAPLRAPRADDATTVVHLKNGLIVAVRRETFSPTVVIDGHVRTNTDLYEPRGKEGVAAITDALLPLGTTQYGVKAFQAQLDAISASVHPGLNFSARTRSADFDRTVQLLADSMLHPAFSPNRFATVSKDVVQSAKAYESRPESKAALARLYALYPPGDPHRRHATARSDAAVTLQDVKRWHAFAYRPDLTTIAVVGDVSPALVKATFEKYFGGWKAVGKRPTLQYPPVQGGSGQTSTTVRSSTAKQSDVTLTQRIPLRRGDRDVVALDVANTMLSGEGIGSMLFHDVRTVKGYVYSIDSDLNVTQNGSTFELTYASDAKNVDAAQRSATQTLERLRRFPPSASELALAKAMLLSNYYVSLDSYDSVARHLMEAAEDGVDSNDVSRYYARVLSVTPSDVRRAMRKWIDPSKFTRVIVAPSGEGR